MKQKENHSVTIEELLESGQVQEGLRNAKDLSEAAAILNAKGVDISVEQLAAALTEGELSEDEMEDIAGGLNVAFRKRNIYDGWCGPRPGEKYTPPNLLRLRKN